MQFRAALLQCSSILGCVLLLASCGSTAVSLDYQPSLGQKVPGPRKVSIGRFSDMRGESSYYLGTVRTPLGTPLEVINTRIPVEEVARNAFAHGLRARGMLVGGGGPYVLTGEIIDLQCTQVVRPAAYVRIRVNIVRAGTQQIIFTRVYRGERESGAYVPGSGSPVPLMRDLTSRALQDVVDRALDDSAMRARLGSSSYGGAY